MNKYDIINYQVADYKGIKYSIQPRGLKSRLFVAFASFVVAFGGALSAATSASAAVPPSATVSPSPMPTFTILPPLPTPTVTAPPVVVTITVVKTVIVVKTTVRYVQVPATTSAQTTDATNSSNGFTYWPTTEAPTASSSAEVLSSASGDGSSSGWSPWVVGLLGVAGGLLTILGVALFMRRDRKYRGFHHGDDTQPIPVVNEYDVSDYDPSVGDYDPALETRIRPSIPAGADDTKPLPPVQ